MRLSPDDYLEASAARAHTAWRLQRAGRHGAAIYFSGVAVECLLRAFITRDNPTFDERHDLAGMYKSAGLEALIHHRDRRQASAWLGEVWSRWKNSYRFASDERLRAEMRRLGHSQGVKGDFLKQNASMAVEAALQLQALGATRWRSRRV